MLLDRTTEYSQRRSAWHAQAAVGFTWPALACLRSEQSKSDGPEKRSCSGKIVRPVRRRLHGHAGHHQRRVPPWHELSLEYKPLSLPKARIRFTWESLIRVDPGKSVTKGLSLPRSRGSAQSASYTQIMQLEVASLLGCGKDVQWSLRRKVAGVGAFAIISCLLIPVWLSLQSTGLMIDLGTLRAAHQVTAHHLIHELQPNRNGVKAKHSQLKLLSLLLNAKVAAVCRGDRQSGEQGLPLQQPCSSCRPTMVHP